jgi:hypothetical protein
MIGILIIKIAEVASLINLRSDAGEPFIGAKRSPILRAQNNSIFQPVS